MPKKVPTNELDAILQLAASFPNGASLEEIAGALEPPLPRRTLPRRLVLLVAQERLSVMALNSATPHFSP